MLTRDFSFRVARLMNEYGELRPGYLDNDASKFVGPAKTHKANRPEAPKKQQEAGVLNYRFDAKKGEYVVN